MHGTGSTSIRGYRLVKIDEVVKTRDKSEAEALRKRHADLPAQWAKVTGKRVDDTPSMPRLPRNPPDAGADRDLPELHKAYKRLADAYWAKAYRSGGPEARARAEGRYVAPQLQIVIASGHAALAVPAPQKPIRETILRLGIPDATAEPIALITADVWRAYARVRTCRPRGGADRSPVVTWVFQCDGVYLSADDGEGNSTFEYVPTGTSIAPLAQHRTEISDTLIWPLRGRAWFWRQNAPTPEASWPEHGYAGSPVALEHASGVTAIIMPIAAEKNGGRS